MAQSISDSPGEQSIENAEYNLFIAGLHPSLEEAQIRSLFAKYGNVETCVRASHPKTGASRESGFFRMQNANKALEALDGLNKQVVKGRYVRVEIAHGLAASTNGVKAARRRSGKPSAPALTSPKTLQ